MSLSKKLLVIPSLILSLLFSAFQTTQALTFTEVVNLLQAPDINLPTGVTNPKGNIGFILSNLFWGTADGTKNGKIKPQYLDYSGISSWTQSGTITYLTASTGSVGIGTPNPGEYSTAIRGIDDTATKGALWVSGQTATTPGLMVRNDGNVGIGTASPGAKLSVNGNSVFGNPIAIPNDLIPGYMMTQFGKGGIIAGHDNVIGGETNYGYNSYRTSTGTKRLGAAGTSRISTLGSTIEMYVGDNGAAGGAVTETLGLAINSAGNVGIGITTPGAKLHILADPQTTFPMYIGTADDNDGATKNPYAWQYAPGLLISNDWDGNAALVNSTKVAKIVLNTGAGGYNNGGSIHVEGAGGYNNGQLIFSTGWDSNSLATERMRLNWLGVTIKSLAGTYTNGSAFVCVNNSGQLYASESVCP